MEVSNNYFDEKQMFEREKKEEEGMFSPAVSAVLALS